MQFSKQTAGSSENNCKVIESRKTLLSKDLFLHIYFWHKTSLNRVTLPALGLISIFI